MGTDLVSACIFCAGLLLGMDLTPRDGLSGQMGFSYATMARRYDVSPIRVDSSDVTPKFVLVGLGNAWPALDGLGAGTPACEWRARVAFGTSHDQQERKALDDLDRIVASGTGRYENFALLGPPEGGRPRLGRARRQPARRERHGPDQRGRAEPRARLRALALGLAGRRGRSAGATAGRGSRPRRPFAGRSRTATTRRSDRSRAPRATCSAPTRRCAGAARGGRCCCTARGCGATSTSTARASPISPTATPRCRRPSRRCAWASATPGRRRISSSPSTYDRQHLPFVSLAVLGTEQTAFDRGYDPDSTNDEFYFDLAFRYAVSPAIRLRVGVVVAWGAETVTAARRDRRAARPLARRAPARDLRRRAFDRDRLARDGALHRRRLRHRRRPPGNLLKSQRKRGTLAPSGLRSHLRLEPRRRRRVSRARKSRARRRDAARRPAVAVGQEPLDRRRRSGSST